VSRDLYEILGLSDRADGAAIKAAYRALAKEFHPDVSIGDPAAQLRYMEIKRAYEILRDVKARTAYDMNRARRRDRAKAKLRDQIAVGSATFILTVSVAFVAISPFMNFASPLHVNGEAAMAPSYGGAAPGANSRPELAGRDAVDRLKIASAQMPTEGSAVPSAQTRLDYPQFDQLGLPHSEQGADHAAIEAAAAGSAPAARADQSEHIPNADVPQTLRPPTPPAMTVEVAAAQTVPAEGAPTTVASAAQWEGGIDNQPPPLASSEGTAMPRRSLGIRARFQNSNAGFSLSYPADVFKLAGSDIESGDRLLVSRDGRALLRIYSRPNRVVKSAEDFRRSLMKERYADATFDDTEMHESGFALSGSAGAERFFERITLSCDRQMVHGWLLVYPTNERTNYDAIIAEIESSYSVGQGAPSRCGEAGAGRARAKLRVGQSNFANDRDIARIE